MQTRGSKFVRFQELRLQERAIEARLLWHAFELWNTASTLHNTPPHATHTPTACNCPPQHDMQLAFPAMHGMT